MIDLFFVVFPVLIILAVVDAPIFYDWLIHITDEVIKEINSQPKEVWIKEEREQ